MTEDEFLKATTPVSEEDFLRMTKPAEMPPEKPGLLEKTLKVPADILTGFAGMPADMVHLAMKLADWKNGLATGAASLASQALGGPEIDPLPPTVGDEPPVLGSSWISERTVPESIRTATAESPMGRAAQEVATFVGGNILPLGVAGKAKYLQAAKDAVVPGLASFAAGEVDPSLKLPAVIAAAVGQKKVGNLVKHGKEYVDELRAGTPGRAAGMRAANDVLEQSAVPKDEIVPRLEAGIAQRDTMRASIGDDFNLTTAGVLDDPTVASVERAARVKFKGQVEDGVQFPNALGDHVTLRSQSHAAAREAIDKLAEANGPGRMSDARAAFQARMDDAERLAAQAARAEHYQLTESGLPSDLGQRVRAHVEAAAAEARDHSNTLYGAIERDYGTAPVTGMDDLIATLDRERAMEPLLRSKRAEYVDPVLDDVHNFLAAQADDAVQARLDADGLTGAQAEAARGPLTEMARAEMAVPVSHMLRVRKVLTKAAREATGKQEFEKAARLNRAVEAVNDTLEHGVDADSGLQETIREANTFFRNDVVNRFRVTGEPAARVMERTKDRTSYKVDAAAVPKELFVAGDGGYEAAERASRALQRLDPETGTWAANPARAAELHNAIVDDALRAAYTPDVKLPGKGVRPRMDALPEAKLAKWVQAHDSALRHPFYEPVRARIANLRSVRRDVENRTAAALESESLINKTVAKKMLGLDDDAAIATFLRAKPADVDATLAMIRNDPAAMSGLRRGLVDHLLKEASKDAPVGYNGIRPLDPKNLGKIIGKNHGVMAKVFDAEHLRHFRTIVAGLKQLDRTSIDPLPGSQTVPLAASVKSLMEPTASRSKVAAVSKLISFGFGAAGANELYSGRIARGAALGAVSLAAKQIGELRKKMTGITQTGALRFLNEALFDPEKALVAAQWVRGQPESIAKVRNYLYLSGDLASPHPEREDEYDGRERVAYPSNAFIDAPVADFGRFSNPQQSPPPKNQPQLDAAETKRIQAAESRVKSARTAAMNAPKVPIDQKRKGVSMEDISKMSQKARSEPFVKMVERNQGDLRSLLAVLEALKPQELDLVRDQAQGKLEALMGSERDQMVVADAMARADALFGGGEEEAVA